ncbi:hypothetical protein B0H11DRAFT_1616426, partial [Mycena galericulata]
LHIACNSNSIALALCNHINKWENNGWIGIPDRAPLQALAAGLKTRMAVTRFKKIEKSPPSFPMSVAKTLAIEGATSGVQYTPHLVIPAAAELRGAKLATLTQALAYKAIKEQKITPKRKTTAENISLIQTACKASWGTLPTPAKIWKSIRHKDISRQIKTFLWKSIHGAHRVGKFWTNIPGYEERATCQHCGVVESLEHILLECSLPGQSGVWKLVEELWGKK